MMKFFFVGILFSLILGACKSDQRAVRKSALIFVNSDSQQLMQTAGWIEINTGSRNINEALKVYVNESYKPVLNNGRNVLYVGVSKKTNLKNQGSFNMIYEYKEQLYCVSRNFEDTKAVLYEITGKGFEDIKAECIQISYIK